MKMCNLFCFVFVSLNGFCWGLIVFFVWLWGYKTQIWITLVSVLQKKKTPNNPPPKKKTLTTFICSWALVRMHYFYNNMCWCLVFAIPGIHFYRYRFKKKRKEEASLLVFIQYAHKYHTMALHFTKKKNVFFLFVSHTINSFVHSFHICASSFG